MDLSVWKKAKKEQKLNYEDIARLSGIPITTVKNVFCGYTTTPRIDTVQAIERALGLDRHSPELTDDDKALGADEIASFPLSEAEQDWVELRSAIIETKGEDFLKTLEVMLQSIAKDKK